MTLMTFVYHKLNSDGHCVLCRRLNRDKRFRRINITPIVPVREQIYKY
jgi:hypothetical protein